MLLYHLAMPTSFVRPVLTPAASRASIGETPPFVSLTTDFGSRDPSGAICRGVILSIAPRATVIDVTHDVAKYGVLDGALLLWCALPYLPVGTHVAVVDPGVGTPRLPVGIATVRGDVLLGPDNGLLVPAAERLGGMTRVHALENPDYRLPFVSSVFHGRDVFAPAAAHLALGVPLHAFGSPVNPADLVRLDLPPAEVARGALHTAVVYVDSFGNLKLAGETADLVAALGPLSPGHRLTVELPDGPARRPVEMPWTTTFGLVEAGALLAFEDSYGRLSMAVNQGSAAADLGLRGGDRLTIRRA